MFKKILPLRLLRSALFVLCLGSGAAQAAVTVSVNSPVSAGMATFTLNSGTATTGYLTVLKGNVSCGSVAETQAGKASGGADAYRRGSLALTSGTGNYTVRNLAQSTAYTVCATDDAGSPVVSANFSTTAMATYASPEWQTVGGTVATGTGSFQSLSFAPDGTPYVAYPNNSPNKTMVKRYNAGTSVWDIVDGTGLPDEISAQHSLSFAPDGTLYVAYTVSNAIKVMRLEEGSTWSDVGSSPGNVPPLGSLRPLSLSVAPDGAPYVAYESGSTITVKYFNGTTWTAITSIASATDFSLSFAPDGTPYVAYSDTPNDSKTTVKRLVSGSWALVGPAGFSAGGGYRTSLAFAPNGTPYVAYLNTDGIKVMSYDSVSGWQVVGTGLPVGWDPSLSFAPDGTPYVVYRNSGSPSKSQVVRYNGTGWDLVGGAVLSVGDSFYPSLSFAPDGTPYVAYWDNNGGVKTRVKRLVGLPGAPTAVTAVAGNGQASVSFTAPASNGGSAITGYTVTTDPAGGVTGTCTASPCTVTGLTNGTPYTFTVAATNSVGGSVASGVSGSVTPKLFTISIATSPAPSAGMATFTLSAGTAATGYMTVLPDSAICGTPVQTLAGEDSVGAVAFRQGSLVLTSGTGNYTVRNLAQSTAYTVCATNGTEVDSKPFTTSAMKTYANPGWQTVGGAVSAGNALYQSLSFAPDGTPYVAYSAGAGQNNTVMHFGGTAWAAVGGAELSDGRALYQSLSFAPDGSPYVVFADFSSRCGGGGTACGGKATVMRYNAAATTPAWELVGSAGFSYGEAYTLSLSFAPDGTPYVIYTSSTNLGGSTNRTAVKRFVAGVWESVGEAALLVEKADYQSLSFAPDGTLYIAYRHAESTGATKVMRLDTTANPHAWVSVSNTGLSKGQYQTLSFAPDGKLYMAYMDQNSAKSMVKRWDGSSWVEVGGAGFSAGLALYQSLSFAPDGTPYVAYRDGDNGLKTTVMRLAGTGTSWEPVGSAGFSVGQAQHQSLSFAPDGTPYVAYQDGINGPTTVMRLVNLSLTSASPNSGSIAGGTSVTLTGANFSGTTTVSFGGTAATNVTVVSATQITATTPSHTAGAVDIVVTTAGGTVTLTNGYTYAGAAAIDGACGSAHSTTPLVTSAPSTNLCTAGTAGSVTIGTSAYTWACAGSGSGANSGTCSASRGYTVTPAVSGAGGSISPAGVQTVAYNATQVFTFTADSGNTAAITSNTCGGALSGSTYTTTAITADCTVTASFTASADTTAPSITNLALSGTPTRSSAGVTVTVNESSTGYWLLVASGSTAPTAAQVVAGVNYAPVTVSAKGHLALAAGTAATINLTGLATGTAYTLYVVAEDASNNQSAIGRVDFTTTQISLNDTGQTNCYNAANAVAPCNEATAGDTSTHPRQDGRYGRDVAGMSKVGGGAAGFDFTRICWNGAADGTATCTGLLVANTTDTASATPATDWACTKDNVTGLVWSLQSKSNTWVEASAPGYADAGHNTTARCGFSADWRMPTRRELLSIVHNGLSTGPVVDVAYFPGTTADWHWSSNSYVPTPTLAAIVSFNDGTANVDFKTSATKFVRLVRSAP